MGNSSSHENDEDPLDPFDGIDTLGYRVLGVQPNSPAAKAGLVSFLDFLVGCEQKMLLGSGEDLEPGQEYDDVDLPALLEENKGKELEFLVWNIKSQTARLVNLTPSDTWGGAGLLGVTIRLDNYAGAEDRLVRCLTVEPNSPAAVAGLVPEQDFLLGTTHQTLDSVDSMAALLHQHVDEIIELYVYNSKTDMVRVVALMPTWSWGGAGLLGAEVGAGYLHRLPAAACSTAGASVERKVRYVSTDDEPGKSPNKNGGILELEPQLEMEPGTDEDEEEDEVESVALETPEQARRKAAPVAAPAPASTSAISTPPRAPLSGGRAPSSGGVDPKEVKAIFDKPPPAVSNPSANAKPSTNHGSDHEDQIKQPKQQAAPSSEVSSEQQKPPPSEYHQASHAAFQQQSSSQQYPGQQQYPARTQNPYPVPQQGYSVSSAAQPANGQSPSVPPINSYGSGAPSSAASAPPLNSYASAPAAASGPVQSSYAASAPPANNYAASASLGPPPQGYYAQSYGNRSTAPPAQQYGRQTPGYASSYAAAPSAPMYGSAPLPPPPMADQKPPPIQFSSAPGSASLPPPPTMLQHSTSR